MTLHNVVLMQRYFYKQQIGPSLLEKNEKNNINEKERSKMIIMHF